MNFKFVLQIAVHKKKKKINPKYILFPGKCSLQVEEEKKKYKIC